MAEDEGSRGAEDGMGILYDRGLAKSMLVREMASTDLVDAGTWGPKRRSESKRSSTTVECTDQ